MPFAPPSRQVDFSAGQQRDVAPHLIDERAVFAILNGLTDDDGSIYKRGGSTKHSNAAFGNALRYIWEGWLQGGRRTFIASTGAFGTLGADGVSPVSIGGSGFTMPRPAHSLQDLLFIGGGSIWGGSQKAADYSTGTVKVIKGSSIVEGAGTSWLANVDVGMLLRLPGGNRVYVVAAVVSDTLITIRDLYEEATAEGQTYSLKRLETASAPYVSSQLYAVAGQRLIACEGDTVRFSEPNKPHKWEATIAPLETVVKNIHEIEEGAQIIGVESLGVDRILVFTTNGVTSISNFALSIVDSLGNSQHRIEKVAGNILWGNGLGVAEYAGSLVVPTMENILLMDGRSSPTPVGQSIMPLYRQYIGEGFVPGGAFVYRNHYFLPIIDSVGVPQAMLTCRLDRPVWMGRHIPYRWPWASQEGAGARISAGIARAPGSANDAPKALAACDDGFVTDLRTFFEPSADVKHDHDGSTALFLINVRDFPAGGPGRLSIGRFRKLRLIYELLADGGEEPTISAEIGTGILKEISPLWDEITWDEFLWSSVGEIIFDKLEGEAPVNEGRQQGRAQNAWVWYLNARARYARFRFQASAPVAKLTIRSLEIFAAASGERHSKVVDG